MPQFQQLPFTFASQFFWLAIVFGIVFFGIGRMMMPKIQSTVEARTNRIAEDLAEADRARAGADETEARWRTAMEESRAEAMKVAAAARQASAEAAEQEVKSADAEAASKIATAEALIREATKAAMTEIEPVAAQAAREMVAKLAGITVSGDRAAEAVKAVIRG